MRGRSTAVLLLLLSAFLVPSAALAGLLWRGGGRLSRCEPPATFYSTAHAGGGPCCATQPGVCPGGIACPANGLCPGTSLQCVPGAGRTRPNVVLMISDDQGSCHYGTAGECRSAQSGTPIPPPATPNLDQLAGHGTIFPVAHNTAAWCFPSLNSILTGRYQRSFGGSRDLESTFVTIPGALRALEGEAGTQPDPFDAASRVGGYCTLLAGKFTGSAGKRAFNARAGSSARKLGKTLCIDGPAGQAPLCGTDSQQSYDPLTIPGMRDLFEFMDGMFYPVPGAPGTFANQPFFIWYAPRIPHAPLRAPEQIQRYLFGSDPVGLGGLFQLGALCGGGACPPTVDAFRDSNFGTEREFYASVFWVDDNIREIRKYLSFKSAPHCIAPGGESRFPVTDPSRCGGSWASNFPVPLERNTVIIYLSDNGWFLPDSKHNFTENGYRTRMVVYDPRTANPLPSWNPRLAPAPPPRESAELAHSTDILPTVLGYALDTAGTQACAASLDGTACDGRDLRAYLRPAGAVSATTPLRHALCGHHTQRGTAPTKQRYLLTRPGSVGRCVDDTLPACATAGDCAPGELCLGGRCLANSQAACATTSQCPKGSVCLGGRCQAGPPCFDDVSCIGMLSGFSARCAAKETRWCRNAPNQACQTAADCPACPAGPGAVAPPCGRVCEARQMKLYLGASPGGVELVDLFDDPDERRRRETGEPVRVAMSSLSGPYRFDLPRLSCCIDDWWPDGARGGTVCSPNDSCPAEFVCNQ